jgi:hypothetical protein
VHGGVRCHKIDYRRVISQEHQREDASGGV